MALFDEDDDDDEHHGHHQDNLLMLPSLFTREDEDDLLMDLTPQESSWSLELLEAVTATPHADTASQQLSYHDFSHHQISNHDYLAAERLHGGQMSPRIPSTDQPLLPSTTTSSTTPSTRTQRRPTSRNAARERSRVQSLRTAFLQLQNSLPAVPPNTKLSKLDVLVLATTYISHLMQILDESNERASFDAAHSCLDDAETNEPGSNDPGTGVHQHRLGEKGYLHPVRKWPMRSRLYAGAFNESTQKSPNHRTTFNPANHNLKEVDYPFQLS